MIKFQHKCFRIIIYLAFTIKYKDLIESQINNYLHWDVSFNNDLFAAYSNNNFTYGISVQMPLFLRKERAELKLTRLNIRSVEASFAQQGVSLNFQAQAALNEVNTIGDQVSLYRRTVQDYLSLLKGEQQKFAIGESSLFLVNAREVGYINSQIKLMDLVRKQQKSSLKVNYVLVQGI